MNIVLRPNGHLFLTTQTEMGSNQHLSATSGYPGPGVGEGGAYFYTSVDLTDHIANVVRKVLSENPCRCQQQSQLPAGMGRDTEGE